ncbi:2Fe-2S iron-sulfur cluster-binding protein [Chelatococcus reniformis]|uniref:Ferredoxin n=1 Tax=Chelatococcus reniformis TaxID=1494448 RepID=A0A916XNP6_9HYPH|nr:2Fe-2S iron-sulfur cluster-binding protein [Chelatococcus reniformis]GGC87259.1 ferredoxin [Chelatococcus reniformis]
MARITYRSSFGEAIVVDVAPGLTLMEGGRNNGVAGILADCGGACACSTCHVYVDEAWIGHLPPKGELEASMLEFALDVDERRSRLSCRIEVTSELDGLLVDVPERQV